MTSYFSEVIRFIFIKFAIKYKVSQVAYTRIIGYSYPWYKCWLHVELIINGSE